MRYRHKFGGSISDTPRLDFQMVIPMDDKPAAEQETKGFWTRLASAIVQMGESYEEQLERRVCRLEAEVSRLSQLQDEDARNGSGTSSGTESPFPRSC